MRCEYEENWLEIQVIIINVDGEKQLKMGKKKIKLDPNTLNKQKKKCHLNQIG